MREDAIFRLYSMTKPVTAVALLMLMEEGKIALDDPVSRFIPGFANLGIFAGGNLGAFLATPQHAADEGGGSAAPHFGPHLRLSQPHQSGRRLSQAHIAEANSEGGLQRHDRGSGKAAAGILAGRDVELFGGPGCGGLSGGD